MKKICLSLAGLLLLFSCQEDEKSNNTEARVAKRTCVSHEVLERQLQENPSLAIKMNEIEAFTENAIQQGRLVNGKIEKTTIVPINSNPKFNQLFFLFDINYCEQNNPNIVETLMKKSFSELWDLDVKHAFFDEFDCPIIIGSTNNDNSIISYSGWIFKSLVRK